MIVVTIDCAAPDRVLGLGWKKKDVEGHDLGAGGNEPVADVGINLPRKREAAAHKRERLRCGDSLVVELIQRDGGLVNCEKDEARMNGAWRP